ncbi:MAG: alpha-L-fucosidase [Lentisphaeria bacterium]|nr:alpha-L-fucosidase [Lentisphaeria bacterium]
MAIVPQPAPVAGEIEWFVHDRFGMFIHWGTYALPARHEWVKNREAIPDDVYQKYFDRFDPDLYDPRKWAKAAREAGMKYFVITTKHHEGFCLFDSQHTDYKATNTPCGKDLIKPMVEAFRAEGLKVGFYYSVIDWHHPHFPIDRIHPMYKRMTPDEVREANKTRDVAIYRKYLHDQVRELLTNYGEIGYVFFDFSYPDADGNGIAGKTKEDWGSEELVAMMRELQPHILINDRLNLPLDQPDVHTPEQFQPRGWVEKGGKPVFWETCQTFSGSWGYHRDETTWKSAEQLVQMLVNTVGTGGNLLMNVGPTARGTLDSRALDALKAYGDWMEVHARSIYGCTMSEFEAPEGCRFTQNGDRLYLHVYNWPFRHLHIDGLGGKVDYVQFLHDASEILFKESAPIPHSALGETQDAHVLTLDIPVVKPDVTVPVIELFLK